jgi:hypothetical protein
LRIRSLVGRIEHPIQQAHPGRALRIRHGGACGVEPGYPGATMGVPVGSVATFPLRWGLAASSAFAAAPTRESPGFRS